jgi:hypothetical protein
MEPARWEEGVSGLRLLAPVYCVVVTPRDRVNCPMEAVSARFSAPPPMMPCLVVINGRLHFTMDPLQVRATGNASLSSVLRLPPCQMVQNGPLMDDTRLKVRGATC